MNTTQRHYDEHLADVYGWMFGDEGTAIERNREFFAANEISPQKSGLAVDLGAGSGFQSIPLARIGFSVTAIDLSAKLLAELRSKAENLDVRCVRDDLLNFPEHCQAKPELIVCMGDTVTHLASLADVSRLIQTAGRHIISGGKFILGFRDYFNFERRDGERFILVQSDENKILTCLLEYEPEIVSVTDILHTRAGAKWNLKTGSYRKLRVNPEWITDELKKAGFNVLGSSVSSGMVSLVAQR